MSVFAADASLPALPLPDLDATCDLVKELAKPLVDEAVWQETCRKAELFRHSGRHLQRALRGHRDSLGFNESWLRELWNDGYLAGRAPLPMEVHYVLELRPERWGRQPLAALVLGLVWFFRRIGCGDLEPERGRSGPLAMDSLRGMAYTRIPSQNCDSSHAVPLTGPSRIAVVCRGRWFILTLSDASGNTAGLDDVAAALDSIRTLAPTLPEPPPAGAMTAMERNRAAALRTGLLEWLENRLNLSALQDALFVVALDEETGPADFGHNLIAGEAANRWYNKSLQIVATPDGRIGACLEHSGCDAGLWIYALNQIDAHIRTSSGNAPPATIRPSLRSLIWRLDDWLAGDVHECREDYKRSAAKLEVVFELLDGINRDQVKSLGCGPDLFAQLAFQTAYYRLTGSFASVYEAVSVRNFYQGRTECARPATIPALAFAQAVVEGERSQALLRKLFDEADQEHRRRLEQCQRGLGAERHMAGLAAMADILSRSAPPLAIPEIFTDPGWRASTRNTLSTSNVAGPGIKFFAFGPVERDGLGIGYAMDREGLQFTVSSLPESKTTAREYTAAMRRTVAEMAAGLSG